MTDPATLAGDGSTIDYCALLFTIGSQEFCRRTSAGMAWNEGVLEFLALGWGQ